MRSGLILLLVVLGLAVAACGGGGGGGNPSAAEFRRQADAVCAKYEGKINALGTPNSLDELGDFVDQVVPIVEEGNSELKKIEPPDEFSEDWDRVLAIQDENLQTTRDLQDAIHNGDAAKVQELVSKLDAAQAESTQIAGKLGLEKCGQSGAAGTTTGQ